MPNGLTSLAPRYRKGSSHAEQSSQYTYGLIKSFWSPCLVTLSSSATCSSCTWSDMFAWVFSLFCWMKTLQLHCLHWRSSHRKQLTKWTCYGYESWEGDKNQHGMIVAAGWCGKISAAGKHKSHRNGDLLRTAGSTETWETWMSSFGWRLVEQESQANLIKLQKSSEKLRDELAAEMKLATSNKAGASYCSILNSYSLRWSKVEQGYS